MNALKIVGTHLTHRLNKNGNAKHQNTVAQIESLCTYLRDATYDVEHTKARQASFVKNQIVAFFKAFLQKRKRNRYVKHDVLSLSIFKRVTGNEFLEIGYDDNNMIKRMDDFFIDYYTYYYNHGQYKKEDFVITDLDYEDDLHEEWWHIRPYVYIKHNDMHTILSRQRLPTSVTAWKKLFKQVYMRSRSRGFFKPNEVSRYANRIVYEHLSFYCFDSTTS